MVLQSAGSTDINSVFSFLVKVYAACAGLGSKPPPLSSTHATNREVINEEAHYVWQGGNVHLILYCLRGGDAVGVRIVAFDEQHRIPC